MGFRRRPPYKPRQAKKLPAPTPVKGPLIIAISIASQRLTVFDDGVPIAYAPVSTGMAGHPTPMGVFSVIQKERYHRSNIYSGAPMPFMQRITWSGVAMHAGVLPGYPASHGCIRMPPDFAVKLYGMTKVGARVVITRHDVTPVEFEHARLAALKKGGEAPSRTGGLRPSIEHADAVQAADAATAHDWAQAPRIRPERAGSDDGVPGKVKTADASSATRSTVLDAAKPVEATGQEHAPGAEPVTSGAADPVTAETAGTAPEAPAAPASSAEAKTSNTDSGPAADSAASAPSSEPAERAATDATTPSTAAAPAKSEPDTSSAPHAPETTATVRPANLPAALPPAAEPDRTADLLPTTAALPIDEVFVPPSRPARPLRSGPVSVFISRKEGKLYVRKGFDPLFSAPVSIARPDQPIGTHVFTAADIKPDGVSRRWFALSIPAEVPKKAEAPTHDREGRANRHSKIAVHDTVAHLPSPTAAEALDRVDLSPDLSEQISTLMSVGASLIISDQGLGYETGLETDFIVVTPVERSARPSRRGGGGGVVPTARKSRFEPITFW